ncbi:MAG: response regulator transcription factor [Nitrospira sp.]|jgi:two-component system phosphate regulon response regulator PhoB|nr:response regulator transcription factor [Nitrospira sp.]
MTTSIVQIIEDEPLHADLLDRALRQAHFATTLARDGESGWRDAQRLQPSLILLDLMLPGLSGHEVCRLVRRTPTTRHIPIIMLTAVGSEADRIAGLEMGADDYVVKPFSPREVVSRVQAVLRRVNETRREDPVLFPDTSITMEGPYFVLTLQQRQITVSSTELKLLQYLVTRDGELVRDDELLTLPGEEFGNTSREELDHRVRFLRRKLENSGTGSLEILPGSRYRFLSRPSPT